MPTLRRPGRVTFVIVGILETAIGLMKAIWADSFAAQVTGLHRAQRDNAVPYVAFWKPANLASFRRLRQGQLVLSISDL
jgi:hypothetical protein